MASLKTSLITLPSGTVSNFKDWQTKSPCRYTCQQKRDCWQLEHSGSPSPTKANAYHSSPEDYCLLGLRQRISTDQNTAGSDVSCKVSLCDIGFLTNDPKADEPVCLLPKPKIYPDKADSSSPSKVPKAALDCSVDLCDIRCKLSNGGGNDDIDETSNASSSNDADSGIGIDSNFTPSCPNSPVSVSHAPSHDGPSKISGSGSAKETSTHFRARHCRGNCLYTKLFAPHHNKRPPYNGVDIEDWSIPLSLEVISALRVTLPLEGRRPNRSLYTASGFSNNALDRELICKWKGCHFQVLDPENGGANNSYVVRAKGKVGRRKHLDSLQILIDHIHTQHLGISNPNPSNPPLTTVSDRFEFPKNDTSSRESDQSDSENEDLTTANACLWAGCKYYGLPARSSAWIRRHVIFHVTATPFRCMVGSCRASFSSALALERHINCRHLRGKARSAWKEAPCQRENSSGEAAYVNGSYPLAGDGRGHKGAPNKSTSTVRRHDYISSHIYDLMAIKLYVNSGIEINHQFNTKPKLPHNSPNDAKPDPEPKPQQMTMPLLFQ